MTVTISAKGQMVIPVALRRKYSIRPNSRIELIDTGEEIVIVPLSFSNNFDSARGMLTGVSTEDLIRARRAERLRDQLKEKSA